jgi:hypothetical protein
VIDPLRREGDAFKVLLYVLAVFVVLLVLTLIVRAL